jgi:hypothetical protein
MCPLFLIVAKEVTIAGKKYVRICYKRGYIYGIFFIYFNHYTNPDNIGDDILFIENGKSK